jgi:uncharacterized protein (DUF342 family)
MKGKSIVSKGKTVKKAVNLALDLLSESMEDVDIEVIENESKGILGIGSKYAVVRVTVKQPAAQKEAAVGHLLSLEALDTLIKSIELPENVIDENLSDNNKRVQPPPSDLLGKAWVNDGQIYCKDAPDKYPVISPGKGMKLYKNDILIVKTVIISETDILRLELQEDEVQEPHWELTISSDKMEAVLKVIPGSRIIRRLKEKVPNTYLQLEVDEKKIPLMIKSDLMLASLREMGISCGINYSEIAQASVSEEAGTYIIAKGTPPKPGKNGFFQPAQELSIKKGVKERSDGTIDYREVQQFPSVEPGQLIGVIISPESGIPGTGVTGETIMPPDGFPLVVQEGKGVFLMDDRTKVFATEAGHPDIKMKGQLLKIAVVTKLLISHNVSLQFGNVHYIGDVEIVGSVEDGMLVEAQGNILIHVNANMATVHAGSSVIVGNNIITSEVTAGKLSFVLSELIDILEALIKHIKQMIAAIDQLSNVSAFKMSSFNQAGLGSLIKILCDGKFKLFPPLLLSFNEKIKAEKAKLDKDWLDLNDQLIKGFLMTHVSSFRSIDDLCLIVINAEGLLASTQMDLENHGCFIKAGFVHNSRIYSSGDIVIFGQGVYNSKMRAGGCITIDGLVRGGEIIATKSVIIGEAGTIGGMGTKITVPKGESIKIKTVLADTEVQIGALRHKFTDTLSNVFVRVGEEGHLLLT